MALAVLPKEMVFFLEEWNIENAIIYIKVYTHLTGVYKQLVIIYSRIIMISRAFLVFPLDFLPFSSTKMEWGRVLAFDYDCVAVVDQDILNWRKWQQFEKRLYRARHPSI